MKSTAEIISILKEFTQEASGLDIFVTLQESDFFTLEKIKEELEQLVHFKIDIVNFRDSLRNSFKQNILKDAIYI